MLRISFVALLGTAITLAAATARAGAITIERAVLARVFISATGEEQVCVHGAASETGCLMFRVSGIAPDDLVRSWMDKKVTLEGGGKAYAISTVITQGACALVAVNVPKAVRQFTITIADTPPVTFAVPETEVARITQKELCVQAAGRGRAGTAGRNR